LILRGTPSFLESEARCPFHLADGVSLKLNKIGSKSESNYNSGGIFDVLKAKCGEK